jgi:hypothetical protein
VADDIEVHYNAGSGELSLACGDEAFAQVRDAIIVAAGLEDMGIEGVPAGVKMVVVEKVKERKAESRLRDRLALLGCGLVGFALLITLAIGVGRIVGWMR